MKILGIDPSLNSTGVCILEDGAIWYLATLRPPGTFSRDEKLHRLFQRLRGLADGLVADRDVAVIEGYAFGSKYQRETMGEVSGVIRLALIEAGIPCTVIPVASWQKQLIGRVVVKDLREELLRKRFRGVMDRIPPDRMDEVEAWALAYAGWERHTGVYVPPPTPPKKSRVKAK